MIVAVAEEIMMIEPPAVIALTSACINWNGPLNCKSIIRCSSWSVVSSKGLSSPQPVQLIPTSTRPCRSRA
jgi:hypothetical protein